MLNGVILLLLRDLLPVFLAMPEIVGILDKSIPEGFGEGGEIQKKESQQDIERVAMR